MIKQKIKNDNGFTLLEVMISLCIISIALVSVFKLHSQTISMTNYVGFYSIAPLLAQKKISDIEFDPNSLQTQGTGDFGDTFSGYRWQSSVEPVTTEIFKGFEENLKQIKVTISYNNDELNYHLRTYRFFEKKN